MNELSDGDSARTFARWRVTGGFVAAVVMLALARPTWESWVAGFVDCGRRREPAALGRRPSREGARGDAVGPVPLRAASAVRRVDDHGARRRGRVPRRGAGARGGPLHGRDDSGCGAGGGGSSLRQAFGSTYDDYAASRAEPMRRRFSVQRARAQPRVSRGRRACCSDSRCLRSRFSRPYN